MLTILRLGHRPARDKRITTHCALVARAFNADKIIVDKKDIKLEETVNSVIDRFGGPFEIKSGVKWRKLVNTWPGKIVHLTMYGEHIDSIIKKIPKKGDILVIIGSEKVPRVVYDKANFNIAVGNQPHSEVAALAIFLDRYFIGTEFNKKFKGELTIIGNPKGKTVIENDLKYPNREQCLQLLNHEGCPEKVITHIFVVTDLALKIAERIKNVDKDLIACGALLHDIGRSRTHSIDHAVEGVKIAKKHGIPNQVIRIIERHICAGIPKNDAEELGLPPKEYMPVTLEEQIVAHADNLVDGNKRCKLARTMQILESKGLPEVAKRVKKLHEKLSAIAGIDLDEI